MPSVIAAIGSYLPPRIVTNDELAEQLDTSDEWIWEHTGIRSRRIAAAEQSCSDIALLAALSALENSGLTAKEIELIIVATTCPDYPNFPSTACLLQKKIGAGFCPAFDIFAACSGFVYALSIADSMISAGRCTNALIVGAELLSRLVDWQDRATCVLFGDGAGAAVLRASHQYGILDSLHYADGSLAETLVLPGGGSRLPFPQCRPEDLVLKMNGRAVYNFAVRSIQQIIHELLERNHKTWQELRYIVPHQANLRIIQSVAKRERIPLDKFYVNIDRFANTSSASIPIALKELSDKNLLSEGDLLLLVGFGAGTTWGGVLVRWCSAIDSVDER